MNRKTPAESGGRPSKGNYFEERAEKGSFLFNFKVSKDLRKQDGLKTSKILTVESLFIFAFFIGIRNAKINVSCVMRTKGFTGWFNFVILRCLYYIFFYIIN